MGKYFGFVKFVMVTAAVFLSAVAANADGSGKVAGSIAPLHSIVSGVTKGAETVELIIPAEVSPHGFSMKPSAIRKMTGAKAVFYIGDDFETFLLKPLNSLPKQVRKFPVAEISGIKLLNTVNRNTRKNNNRHHEHGHEEHHGHHHGNYDMHVWLSPENAEKIAVTVAKKMSQINPKKRNLYKKNLRKFIKRLKNLDAEIRNELAGLEKIPYAVFHDSYRYFEREYGLNPVGSVTINPEAPPSVAEIKRIRSSIREEGAVCVFSEPQFGKRIIQTVVEGTKAKTGVLDPLGKGLIPGPDLYVEMMKNLAHSMKKCLSS